VLNSPLIVGAGPAGLRIANNLLRAGFEPVILEEHETIGKPVQCAGLVSTNILKICDVPKSCMLNKIYGARFVGKNASTLILSNKVQAFVIDREAFDKSLVNDKVCILKGHRVYKHEYTKKGIRVMTERSAFSSKLLVDCSGPKRDTKLLTGIQARVRLPHDPTYVELHFDACKDFFGWIVPESDEISRVGLATAYKPKEHFNAFLKKLNIDKIIELTGGQIPVSLASFCNDNFIRVGDSAGQVKATTGGGIITGLLSADIASKAVVKAYECNNFSKEFFLENYYKPFMKSVGKELKLHAKLRTILNSIDSDSLVKFLERNKKILIKHGDMDFPSRYAYKLATNPLNWKILLKSLYELMRTMY